jgi:hypothetical protein
VTEPPVILIANSAGRVVAEHAVPVAARVAPLNSMMAAARQNWGFIVGAIVVTVATYILMDVKEDEVNQSIRHWGEARALLLNDAGSFSQVMDGVISKNLPDDAWSFKDRDAFDTFMDRFNAELTAITTALDYNKDALVTARDAFHDAAEELIAVVTAVALMVIAVIPLQAIPALQEAAVAIGVAGTAIAIAAVTIIFGSLGDVISAITSAVSASSLVAFTTESRPGWLAPGKKDVDLKDIAINWNDPAYKPPPGVKVPPKPGQ